MTKPDVDALLEIVEEFDAFADERNLFGIVELQAKCPGRDRRGESRKCRPLVNDDRPQSGSLSKKGRRAADDAPANDDEVSAVVRYRTSMISILVEPPGVTTETSSPTCLPRSALPTGDSSEMRPLLGSASAEPTIVKASSPYSS